MAAELSIAIDTATGALLIEGPDRFPPEVHDAFEGLAGPAQMIACAAPTEMWTLAPASDDELAGAICVRIAGFWQRSLIEGPGRRTTVKLQGCPIRCRGVISGLASSVASCSATLRCRAEEATRASRRRSARRATTGRSRSGSGASWTTWPSSA